MAKVSLRAYNREIETMIDRGQYDEAIAHCRHILQTYPKHLETYRVLGKGYLESKQYGDAVDIFSRILAAVANDFVAQVGMSIIRDEENKLDDAIWHMERAFETQPSNPAIQAELQRLYARRDGVRPPRIRMTRGALANMYVQGELYPQAISEVRSVLKEDPERADMQALLARALYRSGSKNEAADVATSLLRRYPYSLDANRVLVEILGSEHPETAQMYRQRVLELDPYAALVTGSIFLSSAVSDAAINVERLEWDGHPVSMQPDWNDRAISAETGEQPDWSEPSGFGGIQPAPESIFGASPPPEPPPAVGGIESAPASIFGDATPAEPAPPQPEEDIPEFMRAAGWGAATGAFDESKSVFEGDNSGPGGSIEQGDLPEWVKAMKPVEPERTGLEPEEELPDWIKAIGAGAIASQAFDRQEKKEEPETSPTSGEEETTQWLNTERTLGASSDEGLTSEFAWLSSPDETPGTQAGTGEEELDWLKDLGSTESSPSTSQEETDWLKALESGVPEPSAPQSGEPDWLKDLGGPDSQADEPDWLKNLGENEAQPSAPQAGEPELPPAADQDDLDWLKGLAVAGGVGAVSHLAQDDTTDETGEESSILPAAAAGLESLDQMTEEPFPGSDSTPSAVESGSLGTSDQEQDDAFAWLEGLAAKQGATEGLLTTPEDRLEEEPEWVKQAKGLESVSQSPQPSQEEPTASAKDLGTSDQEQDDAFAWLEGLAAKQGATEGLLTTPEDRLEEEPEWVKQAKDSNNQEAISAMASPEAAPEQPLTEGLPEPEAAAEQPAGGDEVEAWLKNLEDEQVPSESPSAADETAVWLKNLEEEETSSEPASAADETAVWLKNLEDEEAPQPEESAETPATGEPDWMKNIQVAPEETSPTIFAEETDLSETWMPPSEELEATAESTTEEDALPSWLGELDQEEAGQISTPAEADDLPSWLLGDEAPPAVVEPASSSDWKPVEENWEESPPEEMPVSEPLSAPPVEMAESETVKEPAETVPEPGPAAKPVPPLPTGDLSVPAVDPVLETARNELSQNNVNEALDSYAKLIKKARYLDEVIYDLREALYRYPVDVNLWQSLGDAYMRSNRLQDALDAYTKAEELLR